MNELKWWSVGRRESSNNKKVGLDGEKLTDEDFFIESTRSST